MQTINQLTANTVSSLSSQAQTSTQLSLQSSAGNVTKQPTQQLQDAIELTFTTWKRLFRSKMKDEDWMLDTAEIWAIALTDLQITKKELVIAQRKSMSLEWPPTAPADFIKLSRNDVTSNYPDMRKSYLAAAQGRYKHEVILETAKRVGEWQLKTQPESVSYKAWVLEYPIVCSEHQQGAAFTAPVSHQVEHKQGASFLIAKDKRLDVGKHKPVAADSAMSGSIDDFIAEFGSKKGETV